MRALTPEVEEKLMDARGNGMGADTSRRAKIVATLDFIEHGRAFRRARPELDVARLNFSRPWSARAEGRADCDVRKVAREEAKPIILCRLQGRRSACDKLVDHKPVMLEAANG